MKAYIAAGPNLYVYSTNDALQSVRLSASANDVAVLPSGLAGYVAQSDSAVSFLGSCDPAIASSVSSFSVPAITMLRALPNAVNSLNAQGIPNASEMLALAPPNVQTITAVISGNPLSGTPDTGTNPALYTGCLAPRGFLTVANNVSAPVNLGQGNFTVRQLIVSPDGAHAYILANELADILVYNIGDQTSSAIGLASNASALQASLTPDGNFLYVGGSDGTLHVVDTQIGVDTQQISFPVNSSTLTGGLCSAVTFTCNPDLVAVKP
jgi:WD40 repeat protein